MLSKWTFVLIIFWFLFHRRVTRKTHTQYTFLIHNLILNFHSWAVYSCVVVNLNIWFDELLLSPHLSGFFRCGRYILWQIRPDIIRWSHLKMLHFTQIIHKSNTLILFCSHNYDNFFSHNNRKIDGLLIFKTKTEFCVGQKFPWQQCLFTFL